MRRASETTGTTFKRSNTQMIGVPEGREKGSENILEEIMVESFPNMREEIATEVQEVLSGPQSINPKKNTLRHTLIELTKMKFKEKKILKAAREKQPHTKRSPYVYQLIFRQKL